MLQEKIAQRSNSRRRGRLKYSTQLSTVERTHCGRPRLISPVLTVWYVNGTSVHQAVEPMRTAGICVECHIAWMIEAGLIEPSVHCDHLFRGLGEDVGPVLTNLDNQTLHDRLKINRHFAGGCA
jgi:hypothetical protein